jgi:hypothetical protein
MAQHLRVLSFVGDLSVLEQDEKLATSIIMNVCYTPFSDSSFTIRLQVLMSSSTRASLTLLTQELAAAEIPSFRLTRLSSAMAIASLPVALVLRAADVLTASIHVLFVDLPPTFRMFSSPSFERSQINPLPFFSSSHLKLNGSGETIGIGDTGLFWRSCFFNDSTTTPPPFIQIPSYGDACLFAPPYVGDKIVAYFHTDQTDTEDVLSGHGTHTSAIAAGNARGPTDSIRDAAYFNGVAPQSRLVFFDIHDGDRLRLPDDIAAHYLACMYAAGARISSNSWGSARNSYSLTSYAFDAFAAANADFLPIFAAGNGGAHGLFSVGEPATAKNGLTVGATMASGEASVFAGSAPWDVAFRSLLNGTIVRTEGMSSQTHGGVACRGVGAVGAVTHVGDFCAPVNGSVEVALISTSNCSLDVKFANAKNATALIFHPPVAGPIYSIVAPPSLTASVVMIAADAAARVAALFARAPPLVFEIAPNSTAPNVSRTFLAHFSSLGPTSDGRFKPDIVALGADVFSAVPGGGLTEGEGVCAGACGARPSVAAVTGTSMAAPVVAGAAALVRQFLKSGEYLRFAVNGSVVNKVSSALVKACILHAAQPVRLRERRTVGRHYRDDFGADFGGRAVEPLPPSAPNYFVGFGRLSLDDLIPPPESPFQIFLREGDSLSSGQSRSFYFNVTNTTLPLRVTLVWTDPPALPYAESALINDLDLIVVAPDGAVSLGNGLLSADQINNAETIQIDAPSRGTFAVIVRASSIQTRNQSFAIVASSLFTPTTNASSACPLSCRSRGLCVNGTCLCNASFAGIDCGHELQTIAFQRSDAAFSSTPINGSLVPNEWLFYSFNVSSTDFSFRVVVTRTSQSGDPDIYVRYDATPTLSNFNFKDSAQGRRCDMVTCRRELSSRGAVTPGRWIVGVFGFCCAQMDFSIVVELAVASNSDPTPQQLPVWLTLIITGVVVAGMYLICFAVGRTAVRAIQRRHAKRGRGLAFQFAFKFRTGNPLKAIRRPETALTADEELELMGGAER